MSLKKISSALLSLGLIFTSLGLSSPSNAQKADKNEYFSKIQQVSQWKHSETKSDNSISADITSYGEKTSYAYDIEINSKQDMDKFIAQMDIKFTPKSEISPKIPDIKLFMDNKAFYINKDSFNNFATMFGIQKTFTKDYVKIDYIDIDNQNDLNFVKNISANSYQITEKTINFIKSIDLGIDLNHEKISEQTYTLSLDSNKIVDVINAFFKYVFSNHEALEQFYRQVLGINLYSTYESMGMSKEEISQSFKQALEMWTTQVEPMLPKIKEVIKGSSFKMEEVFSDNDYSLKLSVDIVVDIDKASSLLSDDDSIFYSKESSVKTESLKNGLKISITSNQNTKNSLSSNLSLPSSYDTFNYNEYLKEQLSKWENSLDDLDDTDETYKEVITISPSKKTLKVEYSFDDEVYTTKDLDLRIVEGVLYVSKKDMAEHLYLSDYETDEEYLPFRSVMEEYGFDVQWDSKTHTVVATYQY